jgi:hypothetical protein
VVGRLGFEPRTIRLKVRINTLILLNSDGRFPVRSRPEFAELFLRV